MNIHPQTEQQIKNGLIKLTGVIQQHIHTTKDASLSYGVHWNNTLFQMHPFCWCEQDHCPWCMDCDCTENAWTYFIGGEKVSHNEWEEFYLIEGIQKPSNGRVKRAEDFHRLAKNDPLYQKIKLACEIVNQRRTSVRTHPCEFCTGNKHQNKGAIPERTAPNFWYKPTGFRVWWYKYIGRNMEFHGRPGNIPKMFQACQNSLTSNHAIIEALQASCR